MQPITCSIDLLKSPGTILLRSQPVNNQKASGYSRGYDKRSANYIIQNVRLPCERISYIEIDAMHGGDVKICQ